MHTDHPPLNVYDISMLASSSLHGEQRLKLLGGMHNNEVLPLADYQKKPIHSLSVLPVAGTLSTPSV